MVRKQNVTVVIVMIMMLVNMVPVFAQGGGAEVQTELLPSYRLNVGQLGHIYQSWNNCSGATISMGLSYFGYPAFAREDQEPARQYLKPNVEDQNVSPWQVVDYVNNQVGNLYNVRAVARRGGDLTLLKTLLMNEFPVIIEKGFDPPDEDWMGHYLLMIGYDEAQQVFFTYDSFLPTDTSTGRAESYDYITEYWRHFNNAFIVLYAPEREAELQTILGDLWAESYGWLVAKTTAQEEAAANPQDYRAWWNLGEAATYLGEYQIATVAYRQALDSRQMPWRTMWYMHGAFEAFYQTGQFKTVEELAYILQQVTPYIEEANYYRGLVYAAQGNFDQAIYRLNLVLDFNPNFYPAAEARTAIQNGTFVGPVQADV